MSKNSAFLSIIKKNFKILLRSRSSAVIILLGPLLIVLLVGFAFSNSQSQLSLSVGVYSDDYSELTNSVIQKIASKFTVYQFRSLNDCVKYVRRGRANICILFPPDLDVKGEANEITFYVDYSRINIVWMILDIISEKVSSESTEISTQLTEVLLNKLASAQQESGENKEMLGEMLEKQELLSVKIEGLYDELAGLNLQSADFETEELQNTAEYLSSLCYEAANTSLNIIEDIDEAVYDANCSDSDPIEDVIEPVEDSLRQASEAILLTISENGTFTQLMESVIESADQTEQQLEEASEIRDEAVRDKTATNALENLTSSLLLLETSMEKIKDEITTLEVKNASRITNPITTKIEPVTMETSYFSSLFPTLIVLIVMITSILLASTIVMNEKKSSSLFRTAISPVSAFWFNLGTYATSFLIIVAQLIVFLIVALAFTSIQFLSGVPTAALSLIFIISTFVLFGMLVGYWFKSEETTTLAAVSFSCVFLFFSNTILPIESMPSYVQTIAKFNPFVVAESLLRQALIFHSGILAFVGGILILLGWTALFLVITAILVKASGRSGFFKYKRKF